MIFTQILLYYVFYVSIVLVYGVGLSQLTIKCQNININIFIELLITLFIVLISVISLYFVYLKILIPLKLSPLFIIFCLLFIMPLTILVKLFNKSFAFIDCVSFYVTVPCVFLSITLSTNFLNAILISLFFIISYYLLIPIIYSINIRIKKSYPAIDFSHGSFIFIIIAIILISTFSFDISWLNSGVIR